MFTAIRHFSNTWRHESVQTARLLAELTDESLARPVAEGYRTLGELAWHIVVAPGVILKTTGLTFDGPDRSAPTPSRAPQIHSTYVDAAKAFEECVARHWTDEMLREKVEFYGDRVPRGVALAVVLHHEIHHRGQLTVLMRQAGLRVPGIYGPSKDDRR